MKQSQSNHVLHRSPLHTARIVLLMVPFAAMGWWNRLAANPDAATPRLQRAQPARN